MLSATSSGVIKWTRRLLQHLLLKIVQIFKSLCRPTESITTGHSEKCYQTKKYTAKIEMEPTSQRFIAIPEAKGLPLVGTFFDLIAAGAAPQLHKYIDKRHQQLGPIFRECLGGTQDCVFVASASQMRAVFLHEGQYPRHPVPDAWTLFNQAHNCRRGLFFMEGAEWLHNRRILNRFLLNGNLNWMNEHIEACTQNMLNSWLVHASSLKNGAFYEINNLEPQLYRWAINVICCVMFGSIAISACSTQIDNALNDFSCIVHKIFEYSAMLMNFPPRLAKMLKLKAWTQFDKNAAEVLQKGAEIIDMFLMLRLAVETGTVTGDDKVVLEHEGTPLLCRLQEAGMPLPMIKRIFVDLVIAAGDTTAYATEWALYLLSQDAALQQRLAADVFADPKDVPLIGGLIKETLRLYPVAPFIGRYLATDAVIDGYCIKKDTLVLLSLYTAGREAAHFPDPLTLKPERWQRDATTKALHEVLQAHGTLPFAIGNRSCIGRKLALLQIASLLRGIINNFELKCTNGNAVDCILRLVTVPSHPLQLAIRPRQCK